MGKDYAGGSEVSHMEQESEVSDLCKDGKSEAEGNTCYS